MSSCSGNCSTCGSDCADRKAESLLATLNPKASVKKVIAVVSGKCGVGKSRQYSIAFSLYYFQFPERYLS